MNKETDLNEFFEEDPYSDEDLIEELVFDDSDFKLPTLKSVLEDKQKTID